MKSPGNIIGGRRLVIPDIHGCYNTFRNLLGRVNPGSADTLYLLGDYINRGHHSNKVLDLIISLIESGIALLPLRGNHEQMVLDAEHNYRKSGFIFPGIKKPQGLYDKDGSLIKKYSDFLEGLPYYHSINGFLLVHAGFNTKVEDPFSDCESMIWADSFIYDVKKLSGKTVIHGHSSKTLEEIRDHISSKSDVIPLDNGINEPPEDGMGNLLCLDLDKMELFIEPRDPGD